MTKKLIHIIVLIICVNSYYTNGQNQTHPLVGDATLISSDCYELTSETPYVMGAVWFDPQLDLNEDFDIRVTLNFGSIFQWNDSDPGHIYPEAGGGADGIAFVLQQTSSAAGDVGEALGYGLLDSSVAVEFDPYYNFNADPVYDHIAISKNGNHIHTQSPYGNFSEGVIIPGETIVPALGTDPVLDNIHTGLDYEARFSWNAGTHELDVWFNCQHKFTFTEDVVNTIFGGNGNVYYGFTAATGSEYNLHKVCVSYNSQQYNLQNDTICSGESTQLDAILLNSDPNETSYSWFPTTGLSDPNIANPIASPMSTTTYTVTIEQSCYGDLIVDSLTVFVNNSLPLTIDSVGTLCIDQATIVLSANSDGGVWEGNGILDPHIGNFSPTIAGVGTHEIIYSTTGDCGGADTLYIDVFDVPTANFTANVLSGCSPLTVTFNNTVSNSSSCIWNFGDGTVLTGCGPVTHTFTGSDCFDVSLSVEANECVALQTETDLICLTNALPLTIDSVGSLCIDQAIIMLTASSDGGVWEGNGILDSNIGNFSPIIAGVGTHEIIYSTTGGCGGVDTLYIDVFDVPTVSFTANVLYGCSPLTVTFDNTASNSSSCIWDFGDGTVLTGCGPVTHTFTGSDCFDVSLSVEDNECVAFQTETDLICLTDSLPLIIEPVSSLCIDQAIIVLAANSDGGVWEGNGILDSNIGNFSPIIAGVGTHEIIYSTTGGCGGVDTLYIDVFDVPTASFTANTLSGCSPLTVTFNNTASNSESCIWNFGDGTVLTGCGPVTHTFTGSDCFDVSLSVEANGCSALQIETDLICLTPPPNASFYYSPSGLLTTETEVQFINTSVNANYYLWNFYNTETSQLTSPSHTFSSGENLNYEVCLTSFLDSTCFDTYCTIIEVESEFYFYVPNAFTPDGDKYNNNFGPHIVGANIENYEFIIFNRWGELIFKTNDLNTFWNGEYKGRLCQDGVYIWKVSLKNSNKTVKTIGHVSLLH